MFARLALPGLVLITLALTGCPDDDSDPPPPPPPDATADFTATPLVGTAPLLVTFSNASTGTWDSVVWDFGDGTQSGHPDPVHQFMNAGLYTVELTLYSGTTMVATEAKANYITVNAAASGPSAAFTGSPTSVTVGSPVAFTDVSTGTITTWSWNFGDTGTSTLQNPSHPYASAGFYTVSLTVTGPSGSDTETKVNYITVGTPAPMASFTSDVRMGNPPLTVNFSDTSTGAITGWSWNFGDGGTSTAQNPQYTYTGPQGAQFTVSLTVTGPGGSNQAVQTNYIWLMLPPPPPKPVVYLYPESPRFETVKVRFKGYATITIPEVPLGPEIAWADCWLENGKVYYQGEEYPYLFYESVINWPIVSQRGWILQRDETGRVFLDYEEISFPGLTRFFERELKKAGLYDHEIADFTDYWFGPEERVFFARDTFTYAVRYFPIDQLNDTMTLETENPYESIVRIMYYVDEVEPGFQMLKPIYAPVQEGPNVLHEWGYIPSGDLALGNWR
jgi:PKD repeat protein